MSASRLKQWLRCPLSYRLRYVDGIITPSNQNLLVGRIVHRALERFYRYRVRHITLFPEILAEHIGRIWGAAVAEEMLTFASAEEENERQEQAIGLLIAYLESDCVTDESPPVANSSLGRTSSGAK